jgi:hypothetical protein
MIHPGPPFSSSCTVIRAAVSGINGKNSAMGFLSDHKSSLTGLGLCAHRSILFHSRSCVSTLQVLDGKFVEWDDFFAMVDPVSGWRQGNWTRGSRFMIREKSHFTFFTIDSRNNWFQKQLIPETGINCKNSAIGFFSDPKLNIGSKFGPYIKFIVKTRIRVRGLF